MYDMKVKSMKNIIIIFFLLLTLNTSAQVKVSDAFPSHTFSYPVDIQSPPGSSNQIFIVSQNGIIHILDNFTGNYVTSTFLDISNKVLFGGEQGLLGLAFHPDYADNGYLYINYTAANPRRSIISRLTRSSEGNTADKNSELILLEILQPYSNHNGGQIAFGPDGYLYISLGDGGSAGDPDNRAQNLQSLLGKILRIDVNNSESEMNYGIPDDNPFKGNSLNFREEIFAYGLRNVWRFSFDSEGRLWAADVGQNKWEEISLIENGGNYGWRIMEGFHCYNPSTNCDQDGLSLPAWEYGHNSSGGYSITGGYVYEGTELSELTGKYIYGDYLSGNIWSLNPLDTINTFLLNFDGYISTFGVDNKKDLYFADYNAGIIYRFMNSEISSVESKLPIQFELKQNYPNPFNPTTMIDYSVNVESFVRMKVLDVLGREIITLVNQQQKPGLYKVKFDASKFSTGIYYYSLFVNGFKESRKMIYLK